MRTVFEYLLRLFQTSFYAAVLFLLLIGFALDPGAAATVQDWLIPTAIVLLLGLGIVLMPIVSLPPDTRTRLSVRTPQPMALPQVCVVTGDPATETHRIDHFAGGIYWAAHERLDLPFSAAGWAEYRRRYPLSLRVLDGGLRIFSYLWIFGYPFMALWGILATAIGGPLAVFDLCTGRRPLVRLNSLEIAGALAGLDLTVSSRAFAADFIGENLGAKPYRPWWQFWREPQDLAGSTS